MKLKITNSLVILITLMSSAFLFPQTGTLLPETKAYDLKIKVDYEQEKIFADCGLTIKNSRRESIHEVPLLLYRLFDVTQVHNEQGKPLSFTQSVEKYEDWEKLQVNAVRIQLNPPLDSGQSTTLHIGYQGHLLGYSEVMRYVKDHINKEYTVIRPDARAYPEVGIPSWRSNRAAGLSDFDYRAEITVPEGLVVANGGELVDKKSDEGRIVYIYRSKMPTWRMDFAIADYEILQDNDETFRIFHFPKDKDGAESLLSALDETMMLYRDWFGPLQSFKGLTVIEIPNGYGSQADAAVILQEASSFENLDHLYAFYHELSHLWNVEPKDPMPPRFESEGLAAFLQYLVQEKLEGKDKAVEEAVQRIRKRLQDQFAENPSAAQVPMIDLGEKQMTGLAYTKGMLFFYLLYEIMGEDLFLETVGAFYQKYAGSGATAREFAEFFQTKADVDLERLMQDWIFTAESSELIRSDMTMEEILERY
jgi:hypothetical protein